MKSLILKTASSLLLPLLLMISFFILLRGHYEPGGGFVGGLIASIALVLHYFASGEDVPKDFLGFHPGIFIPIGISCSLISGLIPTFQGLPFLTSLWIKTPIPVIGMVGTALFFDVGVYFVVVGVTLTIIFSIAGGD